MVNGLMELKKHVNDILHLIQIMKVSSELPCLLKFDLEVFEQRFMENSTDKEIMVLVKNLIYQSFNSWRTIQYDRY
jgi:phosphatidylinositol kinase/protein kinase (PI-3  family)